MLSVVTVFLCLLGVTTCQVQQEVEVEVGQLSSLQHGVGGTVFTRGDSTLLIRQFQYDGQGPDGGGVFFYVGSKPLCRKHCISFENCAESFIVRL